MDSVASSEASVSAVCSVELWQGRQGSNMVTLQCRCDRPGAEAEAVSTSSMGGRAQSAALVHNMSIAAQTLVQSKMLIAVEAVHAAKHAGAEHACYKESSTQPRPAHREHTNTAHTYTQTTCSHTSTAAEEPHRRHCPA